MIEIDVARLANVAQSPVENHRLIGVFKVTNAEILKRGERLEMFGKSHSQKLNPGNTRPATPPKRKKLKAWKDPVFGDRHCERLHAAVAIRITVQLQAHEVW